MLRKASLPLAISLALLSQSALAEGYKLFEQSVSAAGNAYAGRGAQITDASLVYSNPAALTKLKGAQFSGGLNLIHATTRYSDASAQSANGMAVKGRDSGKLTLSELVPFAFYSDHFTDNLSWGMGVYAPFGLSSDYQNDWVGRYFADETSIKVVAMQPTLAYKLSQDWSFGLGLNINYAEGTLSKYKDHSGLCELGTGINALYQRDVYNAAYCDSHYEVNGDDVAAGYNLGIHADLGSTKLALVYHSEVKYTLKGDSEINNTPITGANVVGNPNFIVVAPTLPAISLATGKLAANSYLTEQSRLDLTTPANLAFSLDQQLTDVLSVQASVNWTGWSSFESIDIVSDDATPSISLSTQQPQNLNKAGYIGYIPEHWQDSWSYSVGTTVQYNDELTLKTGLAYDENPIGNSHKTARVPTSDRIWWTWGANWTLTAQQSLDFAYGYMWMDKVRIDEHEYNADGQRIYKSGVQATYRNKAQVLAVQWNYKF
ncbi:OmpP1/FadL family transporter [Rheinheimera sp.]|uniref:OmpP1/FadL family transporter n=1 Tax=Rheinheimera sp. TaxID=1869214 RepID=UPI00263579B9|nr:outer membrane protein transport protein [Rheinheimera sp.]MCA1928540.1 OmpP1/FadL family transporter [Rheinheimera sp.]